MSSDTIVQIITMLLQLHKAGNIITDWRFTNELHTVKLTVDMLRPEKSKCVCCGN